MDLVLVLVFMSSLLPFYGQNFVSASVIPVFKDEVSNKSVSVSSIVMPAMARKAGGSWRPELLEKHETSSPQQTSDGYDDEYEDDEVICPNRHFYHIRGKQCVPLKCFGGNSKRDPKTGQCVNDDYYRPRYTSSFHRSRLGRTRYAKGRYGHYILWRGRR